MTVMNVYLYNNTILEVWDSKTLKPVKLFDFRCEYDFVVQDSNVYI